MRTTKLLLQILQNQNEIKKMLNPSVIEKAKLYDELSKNAKAIKIPVKKISQSFDEDGVPQVVIVYEQIVETVKVFSDDHIESSDMFKAMNLLNEVPLADMRKISSAIDEAKKK